jgi:hypothetical protein
MNAKKLIAAVAVFAAASSAFASEWVDFSDFKSTRTRAEVVAELKQAQAQGQGQLAGNSEFVEFSNTAVASGKSRDEVRQEAVAAARANTAAAGE